MTPRQSGKPCKTARRRQQSALRARRRPIALLAVAFLLCNVAGSVRLSASGTAPPDDPTIATAQYGATLGRWFGASGADLAWAFPNLANFTSADLGFMS